MVKVYEFFIIFYIGLMTACSSFDLPILGGDVSVQTLQNSFIFYQNLFASPFGRYEEIFMLIPILATVYSLVQRRTKTMLLIFFIYCVTIACNIYLLSPVQDLVDFKLERVFNESSVLQQRILTTIPKTHLIEFILYWVILILESLHDVLE